MTFRYHRVHGDGDLVNTVERQLIPMLIRAWDNIGTLRTQSREALGVPD